MVSSGSSDSEMRRPLVLRNGESIENLLVR
jgi:hypothetical protein